MSDLAYRLDCIAETGELLGTSGVICAQRAMITYYKDERKRSDDCVASVLTILCDGGTDADQIGKITDLLTHHYSRS